MEDRRKSANRTTSSSTRRPTPRRPSRPGSKKKKISTKRKVMLSELASDFPLTDIEISAIRHTYDIFSKSGKLHTNKIGTVLRLIGGAPTEDEIKETEAPLNSEEIYWISFEKFLEIVEQHRRHHGFMAEELREAFKLFDADGDGEIDASELISILTQVGDPLTLEEAEELVRESDLNGDGKINYVEFVAMTVKP